MFRRQNCSAVTRLCNVISNVRRIQCMVLPSCSRCAPAQALSTSIPDRSKVVTSLDVDHLHNVGNRSFIQLCRGLARSATLESGFPSVQDAALKQRRTKRGPRPRISTANIINSIFEKKVLPDVLPNSNPGQQKNVQDPSPPPGTTLIRRRTFLLDSAAYRLSSLEIFKDLEQKYSSDDEKRIEKWTKEASQNSGNISGLSSVEAVALFSSLSRAPVRTNSSIKSLSSPELSSLACQISKSCTDEEFCSVLLALYKIRASLTTKQRDILDAECERRLPSLDVNSLLLVSDWNICLERKSPFNWLVVGALSNKVNEMSLQNIIQVFYVIGECQYTHSDDFFQKLTDLVQKHLDSFTWNEIGVVCNAFLKSRSRVLSRHLQQSVSSRICQDLHTNSLSHYNLVTAMRFMTRAYFHIWQLFEEVADSLTPHVHDMPSLVPPHIATSFAKVRHFNKPLMDAIASRALQQADGVRLKDIWMLLWAYCRLNYDPPNSGHFFSTLVYRLAEKSERVDHPLQIMKSLVSLTFIEQYPSELIDKVFSPKTLKEYEEKCPENVYKHLYTLDCSVAIERPDYRGNRLPRAFIDKFWKSPHGSQNVPYQKIPGLQEVLQGLQCILGGEEYVGDRAILTHIRTPIDIEVHLDGSSNPVPIKSKPASTLEELISRGRATEGNPDNITRLAILVAPKAHYRLRSHDLLGVHVMKRRQLRKVGYKIVEVPHYEWLPLLNMSESKRLDYLRTKIFT